MRKRKSSKLRFSKREPHEGASLLQALHYATCRLLDSETILPTPEDTYAVFEVDSTVCAFAFLFIGFSHHASLDCLTAEEAPTRILIHLTGKRRTPEGRLTYLDLLPPRGAKRRALDSRLARNCITYELADTNGNLTLTVSLPRYLSNDYDVSSVDEEDTRDRFYDVLRFLSGEAPSQPI